MKYNFNKFKPMLLSNDDYKLEDLDYTNMIISPKMDGVRAEVTSDGLYNRSLKKIRNVKLQEYFKEVWSMLPEDTIIEAEIYLHGMNVSDISGICNSKDKDIPEGFTLYVFDIHVNNYPMKKEERMLSVDSIIYQFISSPKIVVIDTVDVTDEIDAREQYEFYLSQGYEGAVMFDTTKDYKYGRVTIKEHIGYKMKPHKELDLKIIDVEERMENTNESLTNELGRAYKRNTVGNKQATGIAATFICKYKETTTKVTITGDESFRREIWNNRNKYIGKIAVVKSMDYGEKDKLRHPRLLRIKESVEL